MKFAIINDMHIGPHNVGFKNGVQRKLMSKAESLVKSFVRRMNNHDYPEFVICLGDGIEDINNKEADIAAYKHMLALLSPLSMPVYYMVGNHDVRTLTEQEIAQLVDQDRMYYSFDYNGYHIVTTSFEMTENHTKDLAAIGAKIPNKQMKWIDQDLKATELPTLVFQHYGLAEDDMKGNFWFEEEPYHALLENRKEVRKIVSKHLHVKAVFTAHQHWNRMHIHKNIPYFTVTSLTENFRNDGTASEAYTIVEINKQRVKVNVLGNDPAQYTYRWK